MNRPMRWWTWLVALMVVFIVCPPMFAQQRQPAAAKGPYRTLAAGVLQTVDPARKLEESFSRHDLVELLAFDPSFDWARDNIFRHDVWTLEFKFKPMRMRWVDIPQPGGHMRRTLIWYMVYSVTNRKIEQKTWQVVYDEATGQFEEQAAAGKAGEPLPKFGWMHPLESNDGTYMVQFLSQPIRFIPDFKLEARESLSEGEGFSKVYPDRVIPIAVEPIRRREDSKREFLTSTRICDRLIQPGDTLWGVVTWEGIDPKVDRFSIYIQGLTNAYRWKDKKSNEPGAYQDGARIGTGRTLSRKTLKLNFWIPGDEYLPDEREIRYGVPGEVDYEWVWR